MSNEWGQPTPVAGPVAEPAPLIPGSPEWLDKRDALLLAHQSAKTALETAKATEMEARKAAASFVLPSEQRKEGMNNVELGNGYLLKIGHKVNYKLIGDNDKIIAVEEAAEKVGNEGKFIIERLISWKADISVGEYKKLAKDAEDGSPTATELKRLVDTILETSEGAPTLEIKEPKAQLNG